MGMFYFANSALLVISALLSALNTSKILVVNFRGSDTYKEMFIVLDSPLLYI